MLTTSPRSLLMTLVIIIAFSTPHIQAQQTTFSLEVTNSDADYPTRNFAKRESESSPFFGVCTVVAGIVLTGLGLYSLAPYLEESDEHFLNNAKQQLEILQRRYALFLKPYVTSHDLEKYINEHMWQIRYYRILTFKTNLERDKAELNTRINRIEDRSRSLRKKLNNSRTLSSREYGDLSAIKKSLEYLYDECARFDDMLTSLLKRVINLPSYKEEEREKLREERERRHQKEMLDAIKKPTYVYIDDQRASDSLYYR